MDAWSAQMGIPYLLPFGWITSRVPPPPTVASSSPAFHPAHVSSASKRLANKSGCKPWISNPVRQWDFRIFPLIPDEVRSYLFTDIGLNPLAWSQPIEGLIMSPYGNEVRLTAAPNHNVYIQDLNGNTLY